MKTSRAHIDFMTGWTTGRKNRLMACALLGFAFITSDQALAQANGPLTYTNCAPTKPGSISQTQEMVIAGKCLNYDIATAQCGQPLVLTVPAGSTPVTGFMWTENNDMGTFSASFNGHSVSGVQAGQMLDPGTYYNLHTFTNVRFPLQGSWFSSGQATYNTTTSGSCKTVSAMVVYQGTCNSDSAVVVTDGQADWHIEENEVIVEGKAPDPAEISWACAGMSCTSNQSVRLSAIGGNGGCGHTDDYDQISRPGSNTPIWTGPHRVLDCYAGPDQVAKLREYAFSPGLFPPSETGLRWQLKWSGSDSKTTYWQNVMVAQSSCVPQTQCSVTINSPSNISGWVTGSIPATQKTDWTASGGSIGRNSGCWGGYGDGGQLLNDTVRNSMPSTLDIGMSGGSQYDEGILLNFNRNTGNGDALHFNNGQLVWGRTSGSPTSGANQYTKLNFTSVSTVSEAAVQLNGSKFWVRIIMTAPCNYSIAVGTSQGSGTPHSFTGSNCNQSEPTYMGFDGGHCGSYKYSNFIYTGSCPPTPTPTRTFTMTISPTRTQTSTATSQSTSTSTTTSTRTSTSTAQSTSTSTTTSTTTRTNTAQSTSTSTTTATASRTATATAQSTSTSTTTTTSTSTAVSTNTSTTTLVPTNTRTNTSVSTSTSTTTLVPTNTRTNTAVSTSTSTTAPPLTATATNTAAATNTTTVSIPTRTSTNTAVSTNTLVSTNTATATATLASTNTATVTRTASSTSTSVSTNTATSTRTDSNTPTITLTPVFSFTRTDTPTVTNTHTATDTRTATATRTDTDTATQTNTRTDTNTPTVTRTFTDTPTSTNTRTDTNTPVATNTRTDTSTPTDTKTSTDTPTSTNTRTDTNTPIPTNTRTDTNTPTDTRTFTDTPTATNTRTDTNTSTVTNTRTDTSTPTVTKTLTDSPTPTNTRTGTLTVTVTNTRTDTHTPTVTNTRTDTKTPTETSTFTNTRTSTDTPSPTNTRTLTQTATSTSTLTLTPTPTQTATLTSTNTATQTFTATATNTPAPDIQILKTASVPEAKTGDIITYTLTLNVTIDGATGVQVTDVLPDHVDFVSFGNVAGNFDSNTRTLTWTFQTLLPGTYTLTYQGRVDSFVVEGTVLRNCASLTYTLMSGGPRESCVDVQMAKIYTVHVGVYNEAGELVNEIWVQRLSGQIDDFGVADDAVISTLNDVVYVDYQGHRIATWNGTNQAGDPVANGAYHLKIDNVDPFGVVHSVSKDVMVSRSIARVAVNVMNSAGEVVRHLFTYMDDPMTTNPLQDVQLSTTVLKSSVSGTPTAGGTSTVKITSGTGLNLTWDGKTDSGAVVTNGHYDIEVHYSNGTGGEETVSLGLVVQSDGAADPGLVTPSSTLLTNGATTSTLTFTGTNAKATVKVYNTAGQLVTSLSVNAALSPITLNFAGMASGLYMAVVDVVNASGAKVGHQIIKISYNH